MKSVKSNWYFRMTTTLSYYYTYIYLVCWQRCMLSSYILKRLDVSFLGTSKLLIISHHILLWLTFQLVFIEGMKIYQIVYCSLWELLNSFCKANAIKDHLVLDISQHELARVVSIKIIIRICFVLHTYSPCLKDPMGPDPFKASSHEYRAWHPNITVRDRALPPKSVTPFAENFVHKGRGVPPYL